MKAEFTCNSGESRTPPPVLVAHSEVGGNGLPTYRLYRLDGAGKIVSAEWIEAPADEHALNEARQQAGDDHFELWQHKRLVSSSREEGR